jgi:D-amino-acid dehydrogenase
MRVAVIGAGIVGVTTAFELAADGHQVQVFERHAGVAAETSFANAGVVAPGYVTPWASPGMPRKVFKHLLEAHAPVRLGWPLGPGMVGWLWRWWRACSGSNFMANRERLHRLAHYSQERMRGLSLRLNLQHERSQGYLVLLRTPADVALARPSLKALAELGVSFKLVDAEKARAIEPELNPDMALKAAVHLPGDEVGNCRQFAQLLRLEAEKLGVRFHFRRQVDTITPGSRPQLTHHGLAASATTAADDDEPATAAQLDLAPRSEDFDAVVVCAAMGANALLRPLGRALPLAPVHGYSVTMPVRLREAYAHTGPLSALMDERYKVAISRLGQRVRVAGGAEIGGPADRLNEAALATLYKVLDDWFPGCAQVAKAQAWKGARPMLPDGPPVLGESGAAGVWLNLGHGSSGWALACGSARVLADRIAGRDAGISLDGLGIQRLLG